MSPGYTRLDKTYAAFKAALRIEPINISFAVGDDFYYYVSGIYGDYAVCPSTTNHAM